jgi:hypothetical protein
MKSLPPRLGLGLLIGLALGLIYGWVLRPVEYVDTSPDTLRQDFRVDYVLMTAQAFGGDDDLELARVRLAALGPRPALDVVVQAIEYAVAHDFSQRDLDTLNTLAVALRAAPGTGIDSQ